MHRQLSVTLVALAILALLVGPAATASASDRTTFRGCVVDKTDTTITLSTSGDETVIIDTTWLKPNLLADALTDCVTVTTLTIDGHYVAESIEEGDELAR
jgi:uncharacterized protein YggE